MYSINKNQEGDYHDNLNANEAAKKIKELANKNTCFFCTRITAGKKVNTRPVAVQNVDDEGNLWFLSAKYQSLRSNAGEDKLCGFCAAHTNDMQGIIHKSTLVTLRTAVNKQKRRFFNLNRLFHF